MKATKVLHPWSKDALFAKAQRYAEEMFEYDRDDWRFGFWSSLTLELLARAALANISPAILAEQKDWHNVYFALGNVPKVEKFTPNSIRTSEVFTRLMEIVPNFDSRLAGFGILHMQRRNEEVHSGSTPFETLKNSEWLPLFYEAVEIIASSIGSELTSLFGADEAEAAKKLIVASKDKSAKAVGKSIHDHRKKWELKEASEQEVLANHGALWAERREGHRVKCPACKSDALVTGTPVAPPVQKLKDGLIVVTQAFLPSRFQCIACGLKINGLPQLHACGLGNIYNRTTTYEPAEFYAPTDDFQGYEEDNNEP